MYGISTNISHKNHLNVGKYTIHGWYGFKWLFFPATHVSVSGVYQMYTLFPHLLHTALKLCRNMSKISLNQPAPPWWWWMFRYITKSSAQTPTCTLSTAGHPGSLVKFRMTIRSLVHQPNWTNISHPQKTNIFKSALKRGYLSSLKGNSFTPARPRRLPNVTARRQDVVGSGIAKVGDLFWWGAGWVKNHGIPRVPTHSNATFPQEIKP